MGTLHSIGGPARRTLMVRAARTSVLLSLLFVVVYGSTNSSGTGNGWPGHSLKDVNCMLIGKGGGLLPKPGRQIRYRENTPLSNLWLTLAQMAGVERKEFGRSTGTLAGLG